MRLVQAIHRCDVWVFLWLIARPSQQRKFFIHLIRAISHTGDGYLYAAFAIVLYWNATAYELSLLQLIAMAFAVERCIYFILKNTLKRNRPFIALDLQSHVIPSDKFSFPSGHTSAAFLMATLLTQTYPLLIGPFYVWAALVALSRVILRVHFPTDVLIGALLGHSIALTALELYPL